MKLPVPKRGITPREFYHSYVPELWLALVGQVSGVPAITVGINVGGDADYEVSVGDAGLAVRDGRATSPLISFDTDLTSWRIAIAMLPRVFKTVEPRLGGVKLVEHLRRIDLDALRKKPGKLVHVYEDDAGDEAEVTLRVGAGSGPTTKIRVTDTELWKLLLAGGRLSQLLHSRIQVSGDVGYALGLAQILEK